MNRNSHNLKGLTAHKENRGHRWRTVFIALMLALTFGSAGQTPPAQAGPAATELRFFLEANKVNPMARVCVGDKVSIDVHIIRALITGGNADPSSVFYVPGILIKATVQNEKIGSISTIYPKTMSDGDIPGGTFFNFRAKSKGSTTISFEAKINRHWYFGLVPDKTETVTDTVDVTVEDCQYKVITISRWVFDGAYGSMHVLAIMPAAPLANDGFDHYEGSANVIWVETTTVPNYDETNDLAFGTADLTADLSELADLNGASSQLEVNLMLQPVSFTNAICGAPGCGGGPETLSPQLLQVLVPEYGGVVTKSHALPGMTGSTTVYVIKNTAP